MEEIKDNEYIRTKQGTIARIEDTEFDICFNLAGQVLYKNWICSECFYEEIVKHSKNIIDLIEAGDILEVYFPIRKITKKIVVDEYFKDSMILNGINYRNIFLKTILTKEQFARESYKVEE